MANELKNKIFSKALRMFSDFGLRSVSMDDLAKALCISKKTIYKIYSDKDQLVEECVTREILAVNHMVEEVLKQDLNAIHQVVQIAKMFMETRADENLSIMYDLKKYHVNVYNKLMENRDNFSFQTVKQNLITGQNEGLYRKDFDVELVAHLYINMIYEIFNPIEYSMGNKPLTEVFKQFISYHLHGIVSEKGKNELKNIQW